MLETWNDDLLTNAKLMTPATHLLYLHGFRSSPESTKARRMARHVAERAAQGRPITWACPQLPPSPREAWALMQEVVAGWPVDTMAVVGSSLGGFYATALARHLGCRAAFINPAVAPARDLARHIGEQTSFHNPADRFFFQPAFIDEFKALDPYPVQAPPHWWLLVAQGDEVLNWQEMVAAYPGCARKVLPGSDHAVSDFECHLPDLVQALAL
ncbi:MAG: hypothetical protein RLZZ182_2614 [Pseudomonadota bacterium]